MIGVWGFEDKVKVICSGEKVSVEMIKVIIGDIKRVAGQKGSSCCIEIKSFDTIKFTKRGEVFFEKLMKSKDLNNSKLAVNYVH